MNHQTEHFFKTYPGSVLHADIAVVFVMRASDSLPVSFEESYAALRQRDQECFGSKAGLRSYQLVSNQTLQPVLFLTLEADASLRECQKGMRRVGQALQNDKVSSVQIVLCGSWQEADLLQMVKTFDLSTYEFSRYRTSGHRPIDPSAADRDQAGSDEPVFCGQVIWFVEEMPKDALNLADEAAVLAQATAVARDLVNEPANVMTPSALAAQATAQGQRCGFEVEVKDAAEIRRLGMDAFWSVAKGSEEEPKLIVMRWRNNPRSDELVALVGKGLTYDSGGYAIKTMPGMMTMYGDMAGAAAVIGTMSALARRKAEVNVVAVIAACENMISGHAFRNGDIISSLAGKQIEIVNTDAEGRLTLADAVCYADRIEGATKIVDIATLTGAAIIALGNQITAVISDDDSLYRALEQASQTCGDKVWRLPCDPELAEQNKSERADLKNSGGRPAGTTTAGLFIRSFAGLKPWMHLDIAGTSFSDKDTGREPAGGTGCGTELLYHTVLNLFD